MQDASSSRMNATAVESAATAVSPDIACGPVAVEPPPQQLTTTSATTTATTTAIATSAASATTTTASAPRTADTPSSTHPSPSHAPSGDGTSAPEASGAVGVTDQAKQEAVLSAAAADVGDSDESIYGDQDDAQSFIQPAISPIATRLSLPRTPAAERAKIIASGSSGGSQGYFDGVVPAGYCSSRPSAKSRLAANAAANSSAAAGVAAPPPPGAPSRRSQTVRAAVMNATARQNRSLSVGSDALKRLSKALPSISFPKGSSTFFPNLSNLSNLSNLQTSSFFSSAVLSSPSTSSSSPPAPGNLSAPPPPKRLPSAQNQQRLQPPVPTAPKRPPSLTSRPAHGLHRSTSDDSLLYHSLSRVSSLGDGDNFDNIREQVNTRVKAIIDSFPDRPTFKLPSFFPDGKSGAATTAPREPASLLDVALESLTGDVIVLGGYRGSILRSAEPPHRQLWVPVKVGLNIRKVNLEVGLDPEDEANMEQNIFASGMLQHIGPVDISRRLFRKMRESDNARRGKLRVHDYGYDWRLSPHLLSQRLIAFLEKLHCNTAVPPDSAQRGALVIAHSLGGLITRHAVNQRPDLFSGVIYVGTPQRCINILGPLRNGDAVLLNEKVLTATVNFSLRTTFVFLPEDGFCFINSNDPTEEYRVDFYDIQDWIRYRLSPCIAPPALPPPEGGGVPKRSSTIGALLEDLSGSLPSLPLRSRISSNGFQTEGAAAAAASSLATDRILAPHLNTSVSSSSPLPADASMATASEVPLPSSPRPQPHNRSPSHDPTADLQRVRSLAYLQRTLAETKRFRAELNHRPEHTAANVYPPVAVIYGKGIPTVYAARVASRAAISTTIAYDDLAFRSGDGVVLTRESMVPDGYHVVRDGYVSTDRGHVSMLGDHAAVGRALEAVIRGRKKGIGLGHLAAPGAEAAAEATSATPPMLSPVSEGRAGGAAV